MTGRSAEAVKAIARARAECFESGLSPEAIGTLFAQEALLAWMIEGMSERQIHERITAALRVDLREWFFRAHLATGQCDCVREVHFASREEQAAGAPGGG
jgi:hypothetical protein